jgi:hypothetical protein
MSVDECAAWLTDLAEEWELNPNEATRRQVLSSPSLPRPQRRRIAWVGPELVDSRPMKTRLVAIGRVYGVEIVHVLPHTFARVRAQLKEEMPIVAAIVARSHAPHITEAAVPAGLDPEMVLFCDSTTTEDLERQITAWIEAIAEHTEKEEEEDRGDEKKAVLVLMLRAMMSHSKIGQFSHCDRATVFTTIRARGLNTGVAEQQLDQHCEQYQDGKTSERLFLKKGHNDGDQYFLNPKKIEEIKVIITTK